MRKAILAIIALFSLNVTGQEESVKKSIDTFFEGMYSRDTLKIKSVCHESMVLRSVNELGVNISFTDENIAEFYKSIANLPADLRIEERLLEYKIMTDGTLAHAWTPYEFYVNGKLSHFGVNSFQLFNEGGIWKIVCIIDTRRK